MDSVIVTIVILGENKKILLSLRTAVLQTDLVKDRVLDRTDGEFSPK